MPDQQARTGSSQRTGSRGSEVGVAAPGLRVQVSSDIPQTAGLGSSAAAAVAGLRLYEAVTAPRPDEDWLAMATELEGHPDNAAAALLGGITVSCQREDGAIIARSSRVAGGRQARRRDTGAGPAHVARAAGAAGRRPSRGRHLQSPARAARRARAPISDATRICAKR